MWQQPASPAAQEVAGGLWISAPLTQGWRGTSDAAQPSSKALERRKSGGSVCVGESQNLPTVLSAAVDYKAVCTQGPITPPYARSHPPPAISYTHRQLKTCTADQLQIT